MTEKVTRKELFEMAKIAIATVDNSVLPDEDYEAIVEMFDKYIEQLSKPRKKTENKKAAEFRASVVTWLEEHEGAYTLTEIAEAMEVSWQRVSSALRILVADEVVARIEPEDKKGKASFIIA